jgi:hypothetical protein
MAPPPYADFSKLVTDIFNDDYTGKSILKVKSKTPGGVALTVENELVQKGSTSVLGKIGVKYSHQSTGLTLDKLQLKPDGGLALEVSADNFLTPGLEAFYKGDLAKGSLGLNFKESTFNTKLEADLPDFETLKASGVVGFNDVSIGLMAQYAFAGKSTGLLDYNIAAGYSQKDWFASIGTDASMSVYKASAFWKPCPPAKLALQLSYKPEASSNPISVAFGTTYACNPKTKLRAKVDSDGNAAAAFAQTCGKNLIVVGSANANVSDFSTVKYGVTLTVG